MARQDDYVRHTVRFPRELYDRICALPGEGSINTKIVNAIDSASGEDLRDRMAMAALPIMAGRSWDHLGSTEAKLSAWASTAYAVADAMMAARQKKAKP